MPEVHTVRDQVQPNVQGESYSTNAGWSADTGCRKWSLRVAIMKDEQMGNTQIKGMKNGVFKGI